MKRGRNTRGQPRGAERVQWRGRPAVRLTNGVVEIVALEGGGHISEFRFVDGPQRQGANVLWECPWEGAAPASAKARRLAANYGPKGIGEFLASFTGHALCLDYFGAPSAEEARRGLPLHGEAGCSKWSSVKNTRRSVGIEARMRVALPTAGLLFSREMELGKNESVVMFRESVTNQRAEDHYFHWVQHVTFGPPFLEPDCSRVFLSGSRAKTWPLGYEKKSLVSCDREFRWPSAPREKGGVADLSSPFNERGTGFVASVLLDPGRGMQFVAALNWRMGLVSGYCFRRKDFPWVAVWEENCAREYVPWNGRTQARGMEFGTTPMPIGKEASFLSGELFDTPCWARIAARGTRAASYAAFLAEVPKSWRHIRDVHAVNNHLVIQGSSSRAVVRLEALGISELNG